MPDLAINKKGATAVAKEEISHPINKQCKPTTNSRDSNTNHNHQKDGTATAAHKTMGETVIIISRILTQQKTTQIYGIVSRADTTWTMAVFTVLHESQTTLRMCNVTTHAK